MLAFAERTWRGGGQAGWTAAIGAPGTESAAHFSEFENRLLDRQQEIFKISPFPYHKQGSVTWNFYGPFPNFGNAAAKFKPEKTAALNDTPAFKATGGTIILRHWWYPLVKGVITNPKENTTWYAVTKIWSNEDK